MNEPDAVSIQTSPIPPSPLYQLLSTPSSGRGVFASTDIPAGTLILSTATRTTTPTNPTSTSPRTTPLPLSSPISPLAWLVQRPYRKEACATCFAYNRGRDWKLKAPSQRDCGVVFCSQPCLDDWLCLNGDVGVRAWEALEAGVKGILRRNANASANGEGWDVEMRDVDGGDNGECGTDCASDQQGLTEEEINVEWERASLEGQVVVNARRKERPSKTERRVVRNVVERGGDPDLMYYLLTAVVGAYRVAEGLKEEAQTKESDEDENEYGPWQGKRTMNVTPSTTTNRLVKVYVNGEWDAYSPSRPAPASTLNPTPSSPSTTIPTATSTSTPTSTSSPPPSKTQPPPLPPITTLLSPLFTLTPTLSAYHAAHASLPLYTASYLFLLSLLPLDLLPYLTPFLAHNLNVRAAHNAFSIRPSSPAYSSLGTSDGPDSGEFLGWAIFPTASFFNHSCEPNVEKQREGRVFEFRAQNEVHVGRELCISYLGGEEETLGAEERRERLKGEWGFECQCGRCVKESGGDGVE